MIPFSQPKLSLDIWILRLVLRMVPQLVREPVEALLNRLFPQQPEHDLFRSRIALCVNKAFYKSVGDFNNVDFSPSRHSVSSSAVDGDANGCAGRG